MKYSINKVLIYDVFLLNFFAHVDYFVLFIVKKLKDLRIESDSDSLHKFIAEFVIAFFKVVLILLIDLRIFCLINTLFL